MTFRGERGRGGGGAGCALRGGGVMGSGSGLMVGRGGDWDGLWGVGIV